MDNIIYNTTEKDSTEEHLNNLGLKHHITNLGNSYEFTIWYSNKQKKLIKEFENESKLIENTVNLVD